MSTETKRWWMTINFRRLLVVSSRMCDQTWRNANVSVRYIIGTVWWRHLLTSSTMDTTINYRHSLQSPATFINIYKQTCEWTDDWWHQIGHHPGKIWFLVLAKETSQTQLIQVIYAQKTQQLTRKTCCQHKQLLNDNNNDKCWPGHMMSATTTQRAIPAAAW